VLHKSAFPNNSPSERNAKYRGKGAHFHLRFISRMNLRIDFSKSRPSCPAHCPLAAGESLAFTSPEQLAMLLEAGRKYKAYRSRTGTGSAGRNGSMHFGSILGSPPTRYGDPGRVKGAQGMAFRPTPSGRDN
jgi:hypothetical protein